MPRRWRLTLVATRSSGILRQLSGLGETAGQLEKYLRCVAKLTS